MVATKYAARAGQIGTVADPEALSGRLICALIMVAAAACDSERKSTGAGACEETIGVEQRVASVAFRLGGNTNDPDYLFGEVRDMALLPDFRFVVADRIGPRVTLYAGNGQFVGRIGGTGEGPGEFSQVSDVAIAPDGRIWVNTYRDYEIFSPAASGAAYVRSVSFGEPGGTPVFGPNGEVGLRSYLTGLHGVRVWLDPAGTVLREDTLPAALDAEQMGHQRMTATFSDGRVDTMYPPLPGPFAPLDLLASSATGEYARVVTWLYEIDLFNAAGDRIATIRRDHTGPPVSTSERRREQFLMDSIATVYRQQPTPVEWPPFEVPERKPPIEDLWFDQDSRLWVRLWGEEGDSLATAHVYSGGGELLFNAAWPREVALDYGAIRGDVAIGVATDELGVPEIVKMIFGQPG